VSIARASRVKGAFCAREGAHRAPSMAIATTRRARASVGATRDAGTDMH